MYADLFFFVTSAKEVVLLASVSWVVLLAVLHKNYSADFHKIRRKVALGATEAVDFGVDPDHVMLGLGEG